LLLFARITFTTGRRFGHDASQAECSKDEDPALLLCLLRMAYSDPALRDADGAVALTEDLLSDLLGRDAAAPDRRADTPCPDPAVLVEADRSPSYTELELTVPGLQPQVRWRRGSMPNMGSGRIVQLFVTLRAGI
jgi:hypothetical protein